MSVFQKTRLCFSSIDSIITHSYTKIKLLIEEFYFFHILLRIDYIIPIPPPAGIGGTSSLMFATTDSVVRSVEATLVAF